MVHQPSHKSPLQLDDCGLDVRREPGRKQVERVLHRIDGVGMGREVNIHSSGINEALQSVKERFLYVKQDGVWVQPEEPNEGIFFKNLSRFRTKLLRKLGSIEPFSTTEFVSSYQGKKRKMYERAADEFCKGVLDNRHSNVRAFAKVEKKEVPIERLGFTGPILSKDSAVRGISPRDPIFNVAVGRYLKKLETRIYEAFRKVFGERTKVVSKGRNVREQAYDMHEKHKQYKRPVWVMLDAERFDEHVSGVALKWETGIYVSAYPNDNEVRKLVAKLRNNKITYRARDGAIKFKLKRMRMSGDMNTAMGNCLLSLAMLHGWLIQTNLEGKVSPYDNGDDLCVCMEHDNLEKFMCGLKEYYMTMGFRMKIEKPVEEFEKVVFCQSQAVWVNGSYVLTRQFPLCIDKDLSSFLPITSDKAMDRWFYDMYQCGQALCDGIPVMGPFYEMVKRWNKFGKGFNLDFSRLSGAELNRIGMTYNNLPISEHSRYSFYLAFGITPDFQKAIESEFLNISRPIYTDSIVECGSIGHLITV